VTALKFQGSLTLGVGTATGQVLLYDIRSNRPFQVKDHMYGLPVLDVDFHEAQDLVLSMDSSVIKIWEKQTVCEQWYSFNADFLTEILISVSV
jgi:ribosome biogenesis protein ENP2